MESQSVCELWKGQCIKMNNSINSGPPSKLRHVNSSCPQSISNPGSLFSFLLESFEIVLN